MATPDPLTNMVARCLEPRNSCQHSAGVIEELQREIAKLRYALAALIVKTGFIDISRDVEDD